MVVPTNIFNPRIRGLKKLVAGLTPLKHPPLRISIQNGHIAPFENAALPALFAIKNALLGIFNTDCAICTLARAIVHIARFNSAYCALQVQRRA